MTTAHRYPTLHRLLTSIGSWSSELMPHRALRPYQLQPAEALVRAVAGGGGQQAAVVFSRQAGKDEVLAQLLSFLLLRHAVAGGKVVVAAPTLHPQAAISQRRLVECLTCNPLTRPWLQVRANTVRVGAAEATFASAAPHANARGLTANLLLVANEAQDIDPATWDAVFDPMAASTNATTLFMGTVWSQHGLLARQLRYLRDLESDDGQQRVWMVPWQEVAAVLPAYGDRVRARIRQLGVDHPFIRTEYCLEELDGNDGFLPAARLALMQGTHSPRTTPLPGRGYALLVDVGGEDPAFPHLETGFDTAGRRDSTAVTVVDIDSAVRPDGLPVYQVVQRLLWTGLPHSTVHERLVGLADHWRAGWIVVDATGLGAGLASFLQATFRRSPKGQPPVTVVPFIFTAASKSQLGWDFIGLIETRRFQDYAAPDPPDPVTAEYLAQCRATVSEVVPGPGRLLRWYVPTSQGHDDLVISAALCAVLDDQDFQPRIARGTTGP